MTWRTKTPSASDICQRDTWWWKCPDGDPVVVMLYHDADGCAWMLYPGETQPSPVPEDGEWAPCLPPSSAPTGSAPATVRGRVVEEGRCFRCGDPCHDCAVRDARDGVDHSAVTVRP